MNYGKQIERYAIAAYVQYGTKVQVPLSSGARRELARIKRSVAGLAELTAVRAIVREPFETDADYHYRQLHARTNARTATLRMEG